MMQPHRPEDSPVGLESYMSFVPSDAESIPDGWEGLHKARETLGPDHIETINRQLVLALLLGNDGQHAESVQLLKEVVVQFKKNSEFWSLPWHRRAMYELHKCLTYTGQHLKAAHLAREMLEYSTKVFGDDHPHTIGESEFPGFKQMLIESLGRMHEYVEVANLRRELLKQRERLLGDTDQLTMSCRHYLIVDLGKLGQNAEAIYIGKKQLELTIKLFGVESPPTNVARHNLAVSIEYFNQQCIHIREAFSKIQCSPPDTEYEA